MLEWLSQIDFDFTTFGAVVIIDIVLSGDNAIVIGMAAAMLPSELRRRAIVYGIAAAVILRILFAILTFFLLQIPGLKLVGAILLLAVCWQMWRDMRAGVAPTAPADEDPGSSVDHHARDERRRFTRAMVSIIIADLSMSLDNVLAVAGAASHNISMLVFGLVLSIVLMAIGATLIASILERHRWVAYVGLGIILIVAFDMGFHGGIEVMDHFSLSL